MAKEVLPRHFQDFFSNPVFKLLTQRLEGMKTQAYADMKKALGDGETDKAKSLGGQVDGIENVGIMIEDVRKGLELMLRRKKNESQP